MFRRLFAGAAVAAAVATAPARAAEVDAILPAQTEQVIFVNVRQMLDSDLVKKYALGQLKQALAGNDAKKMLERLGLDPLKDVDRVTAGAWGKDKDDMNFVFVVRGQFDPQKLFKAAEEEAKTNGDKISIEKAGTYQFVKITPENQPKPVYLSVADEKTVVGGTDKALAVAAMKAAEGKGKPALKADLQALVRRQDEKASMFAVGLAEEGKAGELPPGLAIPGVDAAKLQKQIEKLRTFAMTVRLTEDVNLDIDMGMKDADAAGEFGDTIDQLIMTAKQFLPLLAMNQPNAKPLVDEVQNTLKSKVKEKDVTISLKLSSDAIGKVSGGGD